MNKRESERRERLYQQLATIGIGRTQADCLRRYSNTLQRWHELECGSEYGSIQRDETTGKPYFHSTGQHSKRWPVADRERGALRSIKGLMAGYPELGYYVQTDPRGCALYVLRPGDVPASERAESYYSRGVAVW
jgi:hypothetical protein